MVLDLNFSSCKILFIVCIILILVIIIIVYRNNNKVFVLEEGDSSALIKNQPTKLVINMEEPKPIEYTINNINPFDEQLLNLHNPNLKFGDNIINKQELEEDVVDEYEVKKVKPYTPLKSTKKIKLSKVNCNLSDHIGCDTLD